MAESFTESVDKGQTTEVPKHIRTRRIRTRHITSERLEKESMAQANHINAASGSLPPQDAGQASVLLLLMLSTFLLGVMAFAVDLTGLWFHRQSAQSAADAACLAGASDMLAVRAGVVPPGNFAIGPNGDCSTNSSAPLCKYAAFNGYSGSGITSQASNSVSWTFPSSVPGVTSPGGSNPYLQVSVVENVKTYFAGFLHGSGYQKVAVSATCGTAAVKSAPPVVILSPNGSGAVSFTGSPKLSVIGGPSRSLQVNSSSSTAVQLVGTSVGIDFSKGGPKFTGSDIAIYGGPGVPTATGNANPFNGGTTGHWSGHNLPIIDPFGSVLPPNSVKPLFPFYGYSGKYRAHGENGCPDNTGNGCVEFSPGYYPSGISVTGGDGNSIINGSFYKTGTLIFDPGIYYMNGSVGFTGSGTLRMAKPSTRVQTDGIMFYFLKGSLNLVGSSGTPNAKIDNVISTDLTCDGSLPDANLHMPSSIAGNVLWAQCTNDGTYWDTGNDTTDATGAPGVRGILIFQAHTNNTALNITGSGNLGFSGSLYFHSTNYSSVVNLTGSGTTGTFILGEIIADNLRLTGSGSVNLALNSAKTINVQKVALLQ